MNDEQIFAANDNRQPNLTRRRERLRFRSWHRGTREMDLLLGSFADQFITMFDERELQYFEELLGENDPDLYNWYTGQEKVPHGKISDVMKLFLEYKYRSAP